MPVGVQLQLPVEVNLAGDGVAAVAPEDMAIPAPEDVAVGSSVCTWVAVSGDCTESPARLH